jgi:hypothetical protein
MTTDCQKGRELVSLLQSQDLELNPKPPYHKTWSKVSLGLKLMLSLSLS